MKSEQKKFKKMIYIFIFLFGFLLVMYPLVSQYYYRIEATKEIVSFQTKSKELSENEVIRRMELARVYNETLEPSRLTDPYTDEEKEAVAEYARMLEVEEKLGFVEIPKLKTKIPIYAGTKENILRRGAGHLEGTSLPVGGKNTHTVITAHRGLPTAELFTHLDRLKEGDVFYLHNLETVLAYEVDQIKVVEPNDFSDVFVVKGQDYATLLTCTPYMINSHRMLVRGHRIKYVAPIDDGVAGIRILNMDYKDYVIFELIAVLFLIVILIYHRWEIRKKRKMIISLKLEVEQIKTKLESEANEQKQ